MDATPAADAHVLCTYYRNRVVAEVCRSGHLECPSLADRLAADRQGRAAHRDANDSCGPYSLDKAHGAGQGRAGLKASRGPGG